jgi:restriction endonuclease S subunit
LTPAAATLSNPAAAGVKFLRRNCKTLPPPGVKCGRHIHAFLAQGISRYNISKNKMMDIEIPVPTMSEQQQVGGYFRNLDNLITLHQRKD